MRLVELGEVVARSLLAPPIKPYLLLDTALLLQSLLHTVLRLERVLVGMKPDDR